jgi:pimeloyl-ACP methyl ester carboxylesterase
MRERLRRWHGDKTDALYAAWTDVWLSADFSRWSIVSDLSGIDVPTLVVQGREDMYGTLAQVDAITANVPDSASLVLDACGHAPHRDQADTVEAAMLGFIRSHVQASRFGP